MVDSIVDTTDAAACFDEAYEPGGEPRPLYADLLETLDGLELRGLRRDVQDDLNRRKVRFRAGGSDAPFVADPVPRLISSDEWGQLRAGLAQRLRALNALLADVYSGESRIVEAGVIPRRVIATADQLEHGLIGLLPPPVAHVAGFDLVRAPDGRFTVLEDNLRSPSGVAYAIALREAIRERVPGPDRRNRIAGAPELLAETLRAAAPPGHEESAIVLLSDGARSPAWYEHHELAGLLGVDLVTPDQLEGSEAGIAIRDEGGRARPVGVIYRRTDEDRLYRPDGLPTDLGELLLPALRTGQVTCANSFGAGIADDKLVHAYTEEMIHFYLKQEPLIPTVPSYDLGDPEQLDEALERLDELVVKPRGGLGGTGVVIVGTVDPAQRERIAHQLRAEPDRYIAQELVPLSRHPTIVGDGLEPRHVDLRPYAMAIGERIEISPASLTRFSQRADSMIVNSSRSGGAKDTWVVE